MVSEAALEATAAANEPESSLRRVLHFLSGVVGMDCHATKTAVVLVKPRGFENQAAQYFRQGLDGFFSDLV